MLMSLAEGQVALCPAVASGGHDLEQRDLGLAAGNSSVLNAELMAQKPVFCWYLCLLDDLKNLFGFLCLKMELVRTLLGQKRAIICLRVSMVLAVPLDELSHSGSDSGLINNSFCVSVPLVVVAYVEGLQRVSLCFWALLLHILLCCSALERASPLL